MAKMRYLSLVLSSTLALAAGCSQVLGLGDYEVDPSLDGPASTGGEGGDPGQGGTRPSGGTSQAGAGLGGEPSQAGAGGNGGASAGEAGAAGAGGEAPIPTDPFVGCDGKPFEGNEAILRSCLLRVSCQYWQYPTDSISRCISQNTQNAYEGTKCTLDAQTCDDITACEGMHLERTFCEGKEGQHCNGNEVVDCDAFTPYARDCTKYGGTCQDFGVDLGNGDTVSCALSAVTTCTATTTTDECGGPQNGFRYQCQGTVAYGTKCSNFAASCQEIGGDIGCYYPSNTCDEEGVACANGRATWCDGNTRVTYDCGSVGLGCSTEGDYYEDNGRQCSAPGCTPDDIASCQESCDGSKLTVCYGGAPVTVDCKDYGFDVCESYEFDCAEDGSLGDCLYTSDKITFAECEYE